MSAEAGKELADTTTNLIISANLLDPQIIDTQHYVSRITGLEISNDLSSVIYGCTDFIEIPEEGLICNHCSTTSGANGCACVIYDSEKNFVRYRSISDSIGSPMIISKSDNPTGVYVRFNLATGYANIPNDGYAVYKGASLPAEYVEWFEPHRVPKEVPDESVTTEKLANGSVTFEKLSDEIAITNIVPNTTSNKLADARQINNLLDVNEVSGKNLLYYTWEEQFYNVNGDLATGGNYHHMDVPCEPSTSYCLSVKSGMGGSAGNIGGSSIYVVLLDANKNVLSVVGHTGRQSMVITTNENTAYIGVSAQKVAVELQLEVGTSRSTYEEPFEPYNTYKIKETLLPPAPPVDIPDGSITVDKMANTEIEYVSENICDPNECYYGNNKYIRRNTGGVGSFTSSSIGGYTGYIPIDNRGLAFTNILYAGVDIGGAVYYVDSNGNKKFKRSAGSTGIVIYDGGDETLPTNNPLHYPDAFVRFTLGAGAAQDNVMVNVGNSRLPYTQYIGIRKIISPEILPNSNREIESILDGKKIFGGSLDLLLPTRFYYVKGDTLQLFHKGIVKAIGLENRYVKPTCGIGTPYRRYIEFNSSLQTSVGDKTISFNVYDDNQNILGSGSSKIKVVNTPISPSTEKHVLCIGSSTTSGGQWVCEAQRRLLASDGTPQGNSLNNIVFVGKQTKTLYGATANLQGNSGWAWKDFATEGRGALTFRFYLSGSDNPVVQGNQYTNNGHTYTVTEVYTIEGVETIKCSTDAATSTPTSSGTLTPITGAIYPALTFTSVEQDSANPFWDSTNHKLDFTSYVNSYCGGSIDIVYTMLGVNAMFEGVNVQEGYVRTFIEALHDEYPNCTIILATDALPSMIDMMPGYGASDNTFSNTYRVVCEMHKVYQMYKKLELEYTTRAEDPIQVEFESWCAQVDSDYNFPLTLKDVNTRNSSVQEPYANNTIHPGNDTVRGYMQLADAAYRSIVAHLCQ